MRLVNDQNSSVDIRILTEIYKFDRVCLTATEYAINHAGYTASARGVNKHTGRVLVQYLFRHDHAVL